jgi:hypothetical protein
VFVGRASKNQIRKVRRVLQQLRAKGAEQELIVLVGLLLLDSTTDEKEQQVTAVAKLCTELREGPMTPWNGEAADYQRAEAFLSSKEGNDWSKWQAYNCSVAVPERLCLPRVVSEWLKPHTTTKGGDTLSTLEASVGQGQEGVGQRTTAKGKKPIKAVDALSTSKVPVGQEQKSVQHVETLNIKGTGLVWTNDGPSTDDVVRALWQSALHSGKMDRGSKGNGEQKAVIEPVLNRTGDTANLALFVLPEPSHPKYRRSASEGQILRCLRCGMQHPGPWTFALSDPTISVAMPCGQSPRVEVITPGKRGWMKEGLMMAILLLPLGLLLFSWLAGSSDAQR